LEEREFLAIRLALGVTKVEVGQELGCHPGTIRRELKRNQTAGTYLPARAQALAEERRRSSKAPWKMERPDLAAFVKDGLLQYWSPEEIAGRWRKKHPRRRRQWVSPPCLYDWIWRQKAQGHSWHRYLRRAYKKRRKRQESPEKRGRIVGRVGIEERPAIVEKRTRLGDWESDRVEGSGSTASLASHVERKSRYTVLGAGALTVAASSSKGLEHVAKGRRDCGAFRV
jgi:IS30 family transposase